MKELGRRQGRPGTIDAVAQNESAVPGVTQRVAAMLPPTALLPVLALIAHGGQYTATAAASVSEGPGPGSQIYCAMTLVPYAHVLALTDLAAPLAALALRVRDKLAHTNSSGTTDLALSYAFHDGAERLELALRFALLVDAD